jgi:hypothetical protein
MRKCDTYGCKNKRLKDRKLCSKCKQKKNREKNPCMTRYHSMKGTAKRRGIRFAITYEEWERWCKENNYLALCGIGPEDMTVDRDDPDPNIGYTYDNMKMRSKADNCSKAHNDKSILHQKNEEYTKVVLSEIEAERLRREAPLPEEPPF